MILDNFYPSARIVFDHFISNHFMSDNFFDCLQGPPIKNSVKLFNNYNELLFGTHRI